MAKAKEPEQEVPNFDDLNFEEDIDQALKESAPVVDDSKKDKTFDPENLPSDFNVSATQSKDYEPLKAGMYQVEVFDIVVKENFFYRPNETDPSKRGNKYQISTTFVVLKDGENYGRRFWDNMAPVIHPTGKKGATKAYKLITAILGAEMTWDECASFAPDPKKFYENLKTLVGKQIMVTVEIATSEAGKKRNKVVSYFTAETTMPKFDENKVKK